MTITINARQAIDLLRDVVTLAGHDHEVRGCRYVADARPSCIVGWALKSAGVDVVPLFTDADGESRHVPAVIHAGLVNINETMIISAGMRAYLTANGVDLSEGAIEMFARAQYVQDGARGIGNPRDWGTALAHAEDAILDPRWANA